MNLGTQLDNNSFDDFPVVKEGLTLAKTFIENRYGLFKSLDDSKDDDATVPSHVSGDNLPPVIPLHGDEGLRARRSDRYMSLIREPYFSDEYKMPTTAEGGVLIYSDFSKQLQTAYTLPKDDLRRRVYVCLVACGYIHELAHSKVHVKGSGGDQFLNTPTKFRSISSQVESEYYAEELMFGGSLHINKRKNLNEHDIVLLLPTSRKKAAFLGNVDVVLGVVKDKTVRTPATEEYISLLENILRGECQFEEGDLLLRDAVRKSLGIAEQPDAKRKRSDGEWDDSDDVKYKDRSTVESVQDDSDDDWPDWPDSGPWVPSWTRTPDIVSLASPAKNELVIEIQDRCRKPFALYLSGEYEKEDVPDIDDDGIYRIRSSLPKRVINPGRSEYKIDELFRIQKNFDYNKVTVGIGSIFEDYIRVEL